jgi:hypothetical protein
MTLLALIESACLLVARRKVNPRKRSNRPVVGSPEQAQEEFGHDHSVAREVEKHFIKNQVVELYAPPMKPE